jgi:hypothetical protein
VLFANSIPNINVLKLSAFYFSEIIKVQLRRIFNFTITYES